MKTDERSSIETVSRVLDSIPDASFLLDESGKIRAVNDYSMTILGYERDQLIDKPFTRFLSGKNADDGTSFEAFIRSGRENEDLTGQFLLQSVDGDVIPAIVNSSVITDPGSERPLHVITAKEIYELEEAKERLRQSERNYRELFEESGEALIVHDPETAEIYDVNRKMCEMYGYSREEALELTVADLSSGQDPYTMETASRLIRRARDEGSQTVQWRSRHKNGELFWTEVRLKPITLDNEERVLASVRNVDRRVQIAKKREESERRFRQLFQGTSHALLLVNSDGVIELLNRNASELFGYDEDELVGEKIEILVPDDVSASHRTERKDYQRDPSERRMGQGRDLRGLRKDGTKIPIEVGLNPIEMDGEQKVVADVTDISERKSAEEELRENKKRLETILETTYDGYWEADLSGTIREANDAFLQITGYDYDQLIGMPISELDAVETEEEIQRRTRKIIEKGFDRFESRHRRKDGEVIDVQMTVNYLEEWERFVCFTRDISERRELERRLEQLTETTNDVLWMVNSDWSEMLFVNSAYETIYGGSIEALEESPEAFLEEVHPEDRSKVRDAMERLSKGEWVDLEYRVNQDEDYGRWVWVRGHSFVTEDDELRIVGVARDVSQRVFFEKEREKLAQFPRYYPGLLIRFDEDGRILYANSNAKEVMNDQDLEGKDVRDFYPECDAADPAECIREGFQMTFEQDIDGITYQFLVRGVPETGFGQMYGSDINDRKKMEEMLRRRRRELERSNAKLKQFANVAAHDLKQPLRTITSFLDLLENRYGEEIDRNAKEYIDETTSAAQRMKELLDGLLEYSKVNRESLDLERVNLEEIMSRVRDNLNVRLEETEARLNVKQLPEIDGDPALIEQLFQNLLDNALTYRGDESPVITVDSRAEKEQVTIIFSDNGIGIAEEYQDQIFDVFERLHTDDVYEGLGLGLAICKTVMDLHEGSIDLKSEPGEGTTFLLTFPRRMSRESNGETDYAFSPVPDE